MVSSLLPYALTALTLLTAEGLVFDHRHAGGWASALAVLALVPAVMFAAQRARSVQADWRLAAPGIIGLIAWAGTENGFVAGAGVLLLLLVGVATAFGAGRVSQLSAYGDWVASSSALIGTGILAGLAIGLRSPLLGAWLALCGAWLLLWMPASLRRVHSEYTVRIAAPAEKVSAYLLDQRHLVDWYEGYLESNLLPDTPLGLGARFRQVVKAGRRPQQAIAVITAYEPAHHITSTVEGVPGHTTGGYTFSRDEGGTVAVYGFTSEIPYPSAIIGGRAFSALAMRSIREKRDAAYAKLKAILELESVPGSIPSPHDQPHRAVVEQVLPGPVDEHQDPAPEADHVDQVDEEPHQPAEKP